MDPQGGRTLLLASGVVLLSVLLGGLFGIIQETRYTAEIEVIHDYGDLDAAASDRRQETQVAIAQGRAVLEPVAAAAGVSLEDIIEELDVELVGSSEVMAIRFSDPDPDVALALVSAMAERYLDVTAERADQNVGSEESQREVVEERIDDLDERREQIEEQLEDLQQTRLAEASAVGEDIPVSVEEQQLQTELQENLRRVGELESLRLQQELEEAETRTDPAQALTDAYLLSESAGPTPLRASLIGLVIGLVLAAAVVGVRSLLVGPPGRPVGGSAGG